MVKLRFGKTKEITPTASPMLVIKQKGKISICIDSTDVNKKILRYWIAKRDFGKLRLLSVHKNT